MNTSSASIAPSFLLCNAQYLGAPVDIAVQNGRIAAFGPSGSMTPPADMPADAPRIDAAGQLLFPSFIDCHVHLREPGQEYKEDIASGLNAAAHGGFGAVLAMANTHPVNDNAAVTRFMLEAAQRAHPHGPRLYPIGAATMNLEGLQLAPMAELARAGCVAISNDGVPIASAEILRRCMEYAADLGLMLIDHCEDPTLAKGYVMHESPVSGRLGLKGQPPAGEALQVARDIMLAEYLNIPIHLAHISCRQSIDLIRWAKSRNVPVSAETCPHYLLLTDEALENYSANARVNPPLRSADDVEAVRQAVKDGTIDMLVTDHAPHAAHEKETTVDNAPSGISGLDTAVTLSWQLVSQGILSQDDLIRLWLTAPAKRFKLPANTFTPGDSADFFLFNPQTGWTPGPDTFYSKSANTPWLGQTLHGRVSTHWLGGHLCAEQPQAR